MDYRHRHVDQLPLTIAVEEINDSDTVVAVAPVRTIGFARVTGTCRSDRALTLTVLQGPDESTFNYSTAIAVPAATGEGAGAAFSVEVVGRCIRLDLTNASGANTSVLSFEANLRSQ